MEKTKFEDYGKEERRGDGLPILPERDEVVLLVSVSFSQECEGWEVEPDDERIGKESIGRRTREDEDWGSPGILY